MTDTVNRYDSAFLEALGPATALLSDPACAERWHSPSKLPKMSVGALACHLSRQVTLANKLLPQPTDLTALEGGADEHYARAAWVTSTSPDDPENERTTDDQLALAGVHKLLERLEQDAAVVREILTTGSATDLVGLPWQGWSLRRDAFLLTRMLEIVVHSDDLAVSLGLDTPQFPEAVFTPVSELILRLAVRRHGQSSVISTLTRRERRREISAF
ncbi:maleylpyruvate isomerase N-terminal domain-containing protein [Kineosporia babensis]|uniref:Maleylpyruvate isomerase N-terminal domain-containing protein n=1 Tax=Kineosporia babensis TaxID=499548 RepID=A0A9X1NIX3_9ACTN|nr:maleylpyruvate isomerase N-terminal domain-containing protein [Kineosporia babensis]MCD5315872.1 maleylpyruvate isomerase N-terminal domain-containing protein [Kineosporia babensis]